MGFLYRRSFRIFQGMRLNLSKSGFGYSAGSRRYRVTRHAGGRLSRSINLPIRGLSHHRTLQRRSWRVPILAILVVLVPVRNLGGEVATPSAVFVDDNDSVAIGDEAKYALLLEPSQRADAVMTAVNAHSNLGFGVDRAGDSGVVGLFLTEVLSAANTELGREIGLGVLTAPVDLRRRFRPTLQDAASAAGLETAIFLDDPVAVAVSVGIPANTDETVLVCDIGCSLNTTIMKTAPGLVDVVAVDGTAATGGDAWTTALIELVIDKFVDRTAADSDPRDDTEFMFGLLFDIESKKQRLSKRSEMVFRCRVGHYDERITVTRKEFEAATEHLASELVSVVERTLAEALRQDPALTIDRFLLAGGAARMPMIADRLRALGFNPLPTDFECAASKGAAIYGEFLWQAAPIEVRYTAPSLTGTETPTPNHAPTGIRARQLPVDISEPANEPAAERFRVLELEIRELRRAKAILRSTITHLIDRIGGPGDYPTSTP